MAFHAEDLCSPCSSVRHTSVHGAHDLRLVRTRSRRSLVFQPLRRVLSWTVLAAGAIACDECLAGFFSSEAEEFWNCESLLVSAAGAASVDECGCCEGAWIGLRQWQHFGDAQAPEECARGRLGVGGDVPKLPECGRVPAEDGPQH